MVTGAAPALPPLRQELALHPAPPGDDGSPCWHLHDPAVNRFYLIGWVAFEVLSRWGLGTATAIVDAIAAETTLHVDTDTVAAVADFLARHHLFEARSEYDSARLSAAHRAKRPNWWRWLLHNYLFFRIPLLRPDAFLQRHTNLVSSFLKPAFWWIAGAFGLLALALVLRHWESFMHGFTAYTGWQALVSIGVAMSIAKVGHELGHALVARHHGCKVPTMGVAFLVLWPVLYTDTNEAWKLPSYQARRQIALAGMAAESLIAIAATWAWLLLPDGALRAAALFLATTSWVMTLGLNASPFMRFDGYFLLADTLGLPNLHERAFAFGRWRLREKLFGFGAAPPEAASRQRQNFLAGFALATWLYRFVLFLGIAMLVYHAFFKALGIFLMLVEVGWFIVRPVVGEIAAWREEHRGMPMNRATRRSLVVLVLLVLWLTLPLPRDIVVPGILAPHGEQNLSAPFAAQVSQVAGEATAVRAGELLVTLSSPDLDARLVKATAEETMLRAETARQAFDERLQMSGDALARRREEATARVLGLQAERERLQLRAHIDGEIAFRADDLRPGTWIAPRETLLTIVDRRESQVEAFVGEADLERIHVGGAAHFVPDNLDLASRRCRIADIEAVNLPSIDDPALASVHGGPLASRTDRLGATLPVGAIYRVRLDTCSPAPAPRHRVRGVTHLEADGRSLLYDAMRHVRAVLIRESGL